MAKKSVVNNKNVINNTAKNATNNTAKKVNTNNTNNTVKKVNTNNTNTTKKANNTVKKVNTPTKKINTNSNNDNGHTGNSSTNFNSLVSKMTKNVVFENKKQHNASSQIFKNNKNYQSSFSNILAFEQSHHADKDSIDVIIYHGSNNDGLLAAYIAWKYLVKDSGKKDVLFYGFKPGHSDRIDQTIERNLDRLRGKNILILDLSYNPITLDTIKSVAKLMLVIDDHKGSTIPSANVFVGDDKHAACAYTWKFFYPNEIVPKNVMYIDSSDRKLNLHFLPFSHLFASSFGIRYGHALVQGPIVQLFEKMDKVFANDNPNLLILIGKYMEDYKDSIKEQIAISAREITFQGIQHCYILNFNAPSLNKPVARQIITNIKKKGLPISVVLLWGYEYSLSPPGYSITLVEDHMNKTPKYNLPEMARKLGAIGGHPKGGSGSKFEGHFYWSKNIFDLFEKKLI